MIEKMLTPQVRLCVLPETKWKGSYLSLRFLVPLGANASSYALLPYVLSRGSADYPDLAAIDRTADLLYGAEVSPTVSSEGEWQVIGFSASFLSNRMVPDSCPILEGVVDLLCSLLLNPYREKGVFCSSYVKSEQSKLIAMLRARKDSPDSYALGRLDTLMCKGEPYAIYARGDEAGVAAITPESLWQTYEKLLQNAPLVITYSGDYPPEALTEMLTARFSSLNTVPAPLPAHLVLRQAGAPLRRYEESLPVGQSQLVLGLRSGSVIGDAHYDAFSLFFAMLSGAPTARLFTEVREKRSLCYSCAAFSDFHKGVLLISCGLQRARAEEGLNAIYEQLNDLAEGRFSDEELECARRWLAGRYPIIEDSPISLADWYFHRSPTGRAASPAETAQRILRVERQDVTDAARRLSPDTLYILTGTAEEDCAAENIREEVRMDEN